MRKFPVAPSPTIRADPRLPRDVTATSAFMQLLKFILQLIYVQLQSREIQMCGKEIPLFYLVVYVTDY